MKCPAPNCGAPAEASFTSVHCTRRGCVNGPASRSAAEVLAELKSKLAELAGMQLSDAYALSVVNVHGHREILFSSGDPGREGRQLFNKLWGRNAWDTACDMSQAALQEIFGDAP